MEQEQILRLYDALLKDEDFDRLELGLKQPNIFEILHIANSEIRHSNMLAWLLEPGGSHNLGDIFLKRFLREVFSSDKFKDVKQVDVEGLNFSGIQVLREWHNIDILLILNEVVVCIENKVLTKEHSNQLSRYRNVIEEEFPHRSKVYVYLTPSGESAASDDGNYHPVSYEFIVDSIERLIKIYGDSIGNQVRYYLSDYVNIIKRELMETDEMTELANKIYRNHKNIIDFVIDRKSDESIQINNLLVPLIEQMGWNVVGSRKNHFAFTTPFIQEISYKNKEVKNGWNQ